MTTTMTHVTCAVSLSARRGSFAAAQTTQTTLRQRRRTPSAAALVSTQRTRAMAPFRNPFKAKPKAEKGPSGVKTLLDKVQRGSEKAKEQGFQTVLADVRDGISQRNYGNGGSWPEAAEARRKMECPRCGASTAAALAEAEASGIRVDPMGDPVEQAAAGQHPLGWCEACAESNRLIDVSGGF